MNKYEGKLDAIFVGRESDRHGVDRSMGITRLSYKVATADTNGGLFVIEQTMLAKGGPPRHVHYEQDEWFYPIAGEFVVEVGDRQQHLGPGDSLLARRRTPHVWAHVTEGVGRIAIAFSPAGKMEAFFDVTARTGSMPSMGPQLWLDHGMEVLGPPLAVD
ncbi:MAG: cupin domain-containing protein [Anaerolineales bacterium]